MSEPIIYNETDFEENLYGFFTCMKYKGELFTGTVIIDSSKMPNYNSDGKEVVEFKNGNVHGRYLEYNKNGVLVYDGMFEDGDCLFEKSWYDNDQNREDWDYAVSGKEWYQNGELKKYWDGKDSFLWDTDGLLAQKNNTWFYKNGQMMNERLADGTVLFFSSTGEVAIKEEKIKPTETDPEIKGSYNAINYYYDDVLSRLCEELFTDFYPHFSYSEYHKPNRYISFFGWVGSVYSEDPVRGNNLIDQLMDHPTKETREQAGFLKRLAIKKEGGSTERTYWLEKNANQIIIK